MRTDKGPNIQDMEDIPPYHAEKPNLLGWFTHLYTSYFFLQSIYVTILCWTQWSFITRISAIETINFTLFMFFLSTEKHIFCGLQETLRSVIMSRYVAQRNMDEKVNKFKNMKEYLVDKMEEQRSKVMDLAHTATKYLFSSHNITSILSIITYITNYIQEVENLPLPFIFYNPVTHSNISTDLKQYIILALVQCLYLYLSFSVIMDLYYTSVYSCNNVKTDMELFMLSIKEFDAVCEEVMEVYGEGDGGSCDEKMKLDKLHKFVKNLVRQHQTISRKLKLLADGLYAEVIYVNAFVCVQICLAIFCFQRTEIIIFKIKYGFVAISTIVLCYVYSEECQILHEKFEDMANSLFHSSWMTKPPWIQRSILILITRHSRIPIIGIKGIISTNRNHVRKVTQAAYSYFNFLSRVLEK